MLSQLDIEGNILTKLKTPPSGLGGDVITRQCLQTDRPTDRRTDGFRIEMPLRNAPEKLINVSIYAFGGSDHCLFIYSALNEMVSLPSMLIAVRGRFILL